MRGLCRVCKQCAMLLAVVLLAGCGTTAPLESALYATLLDGYEVLERPVRNSSQAVRVTMGIVLQQIIKVDEKNQFVEVNAWLKLTWYDYKIHWNPDDYGGVSDVRFKKSQLWTPDILMYNSVDQHFDSTYPSQLLVYSNGLVSWIPPGVFKLSCSIDVVWFPFDEQHCFLKFGSWTYDGSKVILEKDENGFDLSSYMDNGEWMLINVSVFRNIKYYECCPEPYFDIMFKFTLQRRTLYYAVNLIIPCIVVTMLMLIGFTLPPDAGEKMSLQISIMLYICIFQHYVAEVSPPTSEAVPFLGVFFSLCMFTMAASIVWTVVVLNLHNRNSRSHLMSPTMKRVILEWLPWVLLMRRPGFTMNRGTVAESRTTHRRNSAARIARRVVPKSTLSPRSTTTARSSHAHVAALLVLEQLLSQLKKLNKRQKWEESERQLEGDWKYAAIVIDRLCLFVFTLFILVCTVLLFIAVPHTAQALKLN